jgi:hypothetical protein
VTGLARLGLGFAAALLMAGSGAAETKARQRPFPQGFYGNVTMSRETGDLGGFEVRFYTDPVTAKPLAEFTLCEGWCNSVDIAEVTRTEEGFAFSHHETLESYDDNGTLREVSHLIEYQVIPAGKGWKVRLLYDGNDITAGETWRIKPLKQPFGLITARIESGDDAER